MKTHYPLLLIVCLLLFLCACNKQEESKPDFPKEKKENDMWPILRSGEISKVELQLKEDSIQQRAIFFLNDTGKRSKYHEIGYQGSKDIAYFWCPVKNPFVFEDSVNSIKKTIRAEYEEAEKAKKEKEKDKYIRVRNGKDFHFVRVILTDP